MAPQVALCGHAANHQGAVHARVAPVRGAAAVRGRRPDARAQDAPVRPAAPRRPPRLQDLHVHARPQQRRKQKGPQGHPRRDRNQQGAFQFFPILV